MNRIRLFDLARQYVAIEAEVRVAIDDVFESGIYIDGPIVEAFETEFARYCEVDYAAGTSSGTTALEVAYRALGLGPGDEIIIPTTTYIATAMAASNIGATPVLVDCELHTGNIDPQAVERAITPRTRAIVPVHLYGRVAPMDEILAIARARGLFVIEDAAQAHGARYKGRRAGGLADIAAFSFFPGKNLGAYGDAGAVTTNDQALAERVKHIRNMGQSRRYVHEVKGTNARLDPLQAAILRVKLRHLDAWNAARRAAAAQYSEALAGAGALCPKESPHEWSVYHLYVIEVKDRAAVRMALDAGGIDHSSHYPIPIHLQPAYAELAHLKGTMPIAEARAERIVSLPMFAELLPNEIERVAKTVAGALQPMTAR